MRSWWLRQARRRRVLRQLRLRTPADALLFLRILAFAASVPFLVRLDLPRLQALLGQRQARSGVDVARLDKIVQYTDGAIRAGRPLVRSGCLVRGLTLYYFLSRAGLDLTLCFGVGSPENEFAGHCWLVKDGEPFLEKVDPRPVFTAMYSIPGQGAIPDRPALEAWR